jgi:hypothetical protein
MNPDASLHNLCKYVRENFFSHLKGNDVIYSKENSLVQGKYDIYNNFKL